LQAIDTVDLLVTPEVAARLGPPGYDPVMLATLQVFGYCCGVLSSRAIEARCRLDASFRLACAGLVPDHATSRGSGGGCARRSAGGGVAIRESPQFQ
jgi:transposase